MYDWNDLRYFLELSRQGKLVRAAARLHVDHTTVSRRIGALEKQLDVRLFDKSPRGYQLTDAGLRLLPMAEKIETQSLDLYQELSGKDARLSGTVRVATPEALGSLAASPGPPTASPTPAALAPPRPRAPRRRARPAPPSQLPPAAPAARTGGAGRGPARASSHRSHPILPRFAATPA